MKNIVILVIVFVMNIMAFAQEKITEGILVQSQTMSSADEAVNAQLAMMGEMITTTYFKEGKSRSELSNPMIGETVAIIDTDKKEMLILLNNPMMGKKYVKQSTEKAADALDGIKVEKTGETKNILGYECVRYNVTGSKNGVNLKITIYTTDKLKIANKKNIGFGNQIKGFAMYTESVVKQMGSEIVIKIEVTSVKKAEIADSKFEMVIPEGYEKTDNLPGM